MARELPAGLIDSLQDVPGFDEPAFRQVHRDGQQVTSVRFNPAKTTAEAFASHNFPSAAGAPVALSPVPWCSTGFYLSARPSFTLDPWLHAGAYYVQEASSMFLAHIIQNLYNDAPQPARVLDACAAPGGKSTLLASLLPDSFMVSNEVIKNRVTILAENLSKWGSSNVAVTHNDPRDFSRLPGYFDLVVVDAPCSGSGLFRKDEDAMDEWSLENVRHCSMRQQRILADIMPALAGDGILIYSTCSYSSEEDEDICAWLLDTFPLEPVQIPVSDDWQIVQSQMANGAVGYRFYPDKVQGEGFFVSCFRRKNENYPQQVSGARLELLNKNEAALISPWINDPAETFLFKQKETIIGFPARWVQEFSAVQKALNVRKSGVAIGVIKGKDVVPHHELALSGMVSNDVPVVELDYDQCLRYLKRQDLHVETGTKGWALARHGHLNMGWMKALGSRINNYYPTDWRILKP